MCFQAHPFLAPRKSLYTIVMLWWNNWLDMWSRWAVKTQHDKSSHLQDCAFLLIDLKNNRQPKKPHGHAAKCFATRWRIQMGLPKTIWEKTHFAHGLVQPEDRNDICTSAGGSVAKDKERRGPCRKGSETASPSLYLLIRDAKLIVTTIKLNFKPRTDRKREDVKARRRGTRCDHVKFSRDGRWWNSTVKSHHPTHLVHTSRLCPTSGHCSWWEVLERPDHRGPRGNQRNHTRHSGVSSNRITSLFVYICLHKEEKEKDRAGDVPTLWRFDFYSDYADLRYFWVIVQMIIHLLHYWQLGIFLQSDWYCCCYWPLKCD